MTKESRFTLFGMTRHISENRYCNGFPQGSILGPLLFINIVNSSESLKLKKIADDITLITKININDSINDELAKFYNWLKANKLSLM